MPVSVWTSTLRRTIQTAEHLPFPKLRWKVSAYQHHLAKHLHASLYAVVIYQWHFAQELLTLACSLHAMSMVTVSFAVLLLQWHLCCHYCCHVCRCWMRFRLASSMAGRMSKLSSRCPRSLLQGRRTSSSTGVLLLLF